VIFYLTQGSVEKLLSLWNQIGRASECERLMGGICWGGQFKPC
jgi:hypothetical protein